MNRKTLRVIFWIAMVLIFIFGPVLNLIIDKEVALNFALDRMFKSPLPVRAYFLLLGILTFVVGEISLLSIEEKNKVYAFLMIAVLSVGYLLTKYLYFLLLLAVGVMALIVIFWRNRNQEDAIREVLEAVMTTDVEKEEPEEGIIEEMIEENAEPEIDLEAEDALDSDQQKEINHFLDSLFEKKATDSDDWVKDEVTEPFTQEILSDANEILEDELASQTEEIKKEPAKVIELKKEPVPPSDDLLEEEMAKKEDPLGEFDEEIPMDDFVN